MGLALRRTAIPAGGDGKRSIARLCGKRLQALLPLRLEPLERHGQLALDPKEKEKMFSISYSTIDLLLAHERTSRPRMCWTRLKRARSKVQRRKPVCTFDGWSEVKEGMLGLLSLIATLPGTELNRTL